MTNSNGQIAPTMQQAIASLAATIEQGNQSSQQKLDVLTDQIGHLTETVADLSITVKEGFAEMKVLLEKQYQIADKQAEAAKIQAANVAALIAKMDK